MEGIGTVSRAELSLLDDRIIPLKDRGVYSNSQCSGCGDCGPYKAGAADKFGLSAYVDRQDGPRFRYGTDGDWLNMPINLKEISPYVIKEPEFKGSGETIKQAEEAYRPIVERMNDYLAEEKGAILTYSDLEVKEMEPAYIMTEDGRVAKILGLYSTETNEIFLSNDLRGRDVTEVFEHELLHYMQDKFGVIAEYVQEDPANARGNIEDNVERTQDYINENYPLDDMPPELDHSRVARPLARPGYRQSRLSA